MELPVHVLPVPVSFLRNQRHRIMEPEAREGNLYTWNVRFPYKESLALPSDTDPGIDRYVRKEIPGK